MYYLDSSVWATVTLGQGTSSSSLVALTGDGTGVRDTVYVARGHLLDPVDIRESGITDGVPSELDTLGGEQRTMSALRRKSGCVERFSKDWRELGKGLFKSGLR